MLGLILGPGYVSHVLGSACYMGSLPTHPCLLVTPFGHWAVAPCSLYLDSSFGEGGLGLTQVLESPSWISHCYGCCRQYLKHRILQAPPHSFII